jgi:hypothetical protein
MVNTVLILIVIWKAYSSRVAVNLSLGFGEAVQTTLLAI